MDVSNNKVLCSGRCVCELLSLTNPVNCHTHCYTRSDPHSSPSHSLLFSESPSLITLTLTAILRVTLTHHPHTHCCPQSPLLIILTHSSFAHTGSVRRVLTPKPTSDAPEGQITANRMSVTQLRTRLVALGSSFNLPSELRTPSMRTPSSLRTRKLKISGGPTPRSILKRPIPTQNHG